MTIARVGEFAVPALSADLVRVAQMLRTSIEGAQLADRIVSGLAQSGELDLAPRSAAEKSALERALTELTWEAPRGRLRRLRAAVADVTVAASLEQTLTDDARSAADAYRRSRSSIKVAREEIEAERPGSAP
jgi:hypothetical protein